MSFLVIGVLIRKGEDAKRQSYKWHCRRAFCKWTILTYVCQVKGRSMDRQQSCPNLLKPFTSPFILLLKGMLTSFPASKDQATLDWVHLVSFSMSFIGFLVLNSDRQKFTCDILSLSPHAIQYRSFVSSYIRQTKCLKAGVRSSDQCHIVMNLTHKTVNTDKGRNSLKN